MKTFKNLLYLLTAIVFAFSFTACSNDDDPDPQTEETSSGPIVLSYNTFLNKDDVTILSADTTSISVSKRYLEAMNYKLKNNNDSIPVTIWRTIDTAPFVRNVIRTSEQGDRVILTTVGGDLGDVLGNDDFNLDSNIFVDLKKPTTRGGSTNINSDRYVDSEGVIHPAVIILEEKGIEDSETSQSRAASSEKLYYTADELYEENANFRIINVNTGLGNHTLTSPEKHLKIYVKDTYLRAVAGLRVNVSTKWFKLKKFECAAYGDFALNFSAGAEASLSKDWKQEVNIAKFNCFTSVFWVGPVPVAITCNAGVTMYAEASISASCSFESKVDLSASFDAGVYYNGRWSNRNTSNSHASAKLTKFTRSAVTAKAETGIEMYAEIKLYNCAGPKITFGPSLDTDLEISQNGLTNNLEYSTTGSINVGGKYGVEVKIWKWKLASWQQKYSVYQCDLWNQEGSF